MFRLLALSVLFCVILQAQGQVGMIPSGKGSCSYQFTVPNTNGACSTTTGDLDKKVSLVKTDLDRTRVQYVAQNSALQSTLAKVQRDASTYMSKVADLQLELQKIKQLITSMPTGNLSGANNANLNQAIHDAKDLLTRALAEINSKIYNLTFEFQKNSVEESKINRVIESQISQQAVTMATMQQQVLNLENNLKNLQTGVVVVPSSGSGGSSNPASSVTSTQIIQLQNQYISLKNELQKLDNSSVQQYQQLQNTANTISQQIVNQTAQISNTKTSVAGINNRLQNAENITNYAKVDLDALKNSINPQINIISSEISDTGNKISQVEGNLRQLAGVIMGVKKDIMTDKRNISAIQNLAQTLETQIKKLANETATQGGELVKLSIDLMSLNSTLVNQAGGSGSVTTPGNLTQLVTNFQSSTTTSLSKIQADIKQLQQTTSILMQQVTQIG